MKMSHTLYLPTLCVIFCILSQPIITKHQKSKKNRKLNEGEYEDSMMEQGSLDRHDQEPLYMGEDQPHGSPENNNSFGDQIVNNIRMQSANMSVQ